MSDDQDRWVIVDIATWITFDVLAVIAAIAFWYAIWCITP